MFTGIIEECGKVVRLQSDRSSATLVVAAPKLAPRVRKGGSLAVNGACLTVTKRVRRLLYFDISGETLNRTNFRKLRKGDPVNLEGALTLQKSVDGHFVLGHVDGTGCVKRRMKKNAVETVIEISVPPKLSPLIAEKGSVTVDGVSLTVNKVNGKSFQVALIPFTLRKTNLGARLPGDLVNIEVDPISRYLQRQLAYAH